MTINLHKDFLKNELDLPGEAIVDEIEDTSRWSIIHSIVFAYNGKFWRTSYSVGATESQYERPWEYDTEVECTEVHLVEKTVKVWENVD